MHIQSIHVPLWRTLRPRYTWLAIGFALGSALGFTLGYIPWPSL
jgi:hypothetical protein